MNAPAERTPWRSKKLMALLIVENSDVAISSRTDWGEAARASWYSERALEGKMVGG